MQIVKFLDY